MTQQITSEQQAENLATIQNPHKAEYTLESPLVFGGQTIEKITISKPGTVALSGLSLQNIYNSDVNSICQIIPKCTYPQIPREAMMLLDPVDLGQIAGHIIYFLMPKSQRAAQNIQL